MTGQIELHDNDARLYERGVTVAHSSDGDGMPDVGTSIGLGSGRMLYLGEVPGRAGWSLCIYSQSGPTLDIAHGIDIGIATDAMDVLAAVINAHKTEPSK